MINLSSVITPSEGYWLKKAVEASGVSIGEFAKKVGIGRTTLHAYFLQPVLNADLDVMLNILDVLNIKADNLRKELDQLPSVATDSRQLAFLEIEYRQKIMNHVRWMTDPRWRDGQHDDTQDTRPLPPENDTSPAALRMIPYFHFKLPAGHWADASEPRTAEEADGWTPVDVKVPRDAFALHIEGDCMEPDFPNGSIVVFAPCRPGDHGLQFESGKVYYFQNADGKATFKRVVYEPQRERFRLESLNPKYKPFYVPEQMLARMSRAVRVVRDLI